MRNENLYDEITPRRLKYSIEVDRESFMSSYFWEWRRETSGSTLLDERPIAG